MKNGICKAGCLLVIVVGLFAGSCLNDNLAEMSRATSSTDSTVTASTQSSSSTTTSTTTTSTTSTTTTTTTLAVASFATDIKPLMVKYRCTSCHGTSYQNYSFVSSVAKSGTLLGTMSGAVGYRRMPPSGTVAAADLALIEAWIKAGTPNN